MRKPRDYDAELKALTDKARQLKSRKQMQLGELVMATGVDQLTPEELAGALLAIVGTTEPSKKEAWRKRGAAFFCGTGEQPGRGAGEQPGGAQTDAGSAQPPAGAPGAA